MRKHVRIDKQQLRADALAYGCAEAARMHGCSKVYAWRCMSDENEAKCVVHERRATLRIRADPERLERQRARSLAYYHAHKHDPDAIEKRRARDRARYRERVSDPVLRAAYNERKREWSAKRQAR